MKKIIRALLGLIIIAIIVIIVIIIALDPIGKKISQKYATNLLKTPVKISQFSSSFFDKSLNIDFIEVQNPPSFNNKNALSLEHFFLKLGDESTSDFIVIDELYLGGLEFVLEQNDSGVNLTKLINNLKQKPHAATSSDHHSHNKRIKIKQFTVDNISLKIDTNWLKTTLKVPAISAHNFGGKSGIALTQIGKKITQEILQKLKKSLEKQGIDTNEQKIKQTLTRKLGIQNINTLKNKAKSLFKGFGF